ncbi:MAG: tRNA lysidine(34) synthetase TilS [Clostridia bacterium]|nr:tRNA lysidine(34) synthetase TilS [Clostridia bacterium]
MKNKIEKAISHYQMDGIYDGCIVGFSGGADSSALVHFLKDRCKNLLCVHINHMIRGQEADRDEEFCQGVCEKYGVGFLSFKVDIPTLARERKTGTEETAREERYRIFNEVLATHPECKCIATAHNLNDNAETIVFNLARGSGLNGICGIKPAFGKVYRPLIDVTREEIVKYCNDNEIPFVTDSTNETDEYTRNRIRHNIIPALEEINSGFLDAVSRLSNLLRQDSEYIEAQCKELIEKHSLEEKIPTEMLLSLPISLATRLLRSLCPVKLDYKSSLACLELLSQDSVGKMLSLGEGIIFKVERGYSTFVSEDELKSLGFCVPLDKEINYIEPLDIYITVNKELSGAEFTKALTLSLNESRIFGSLHVRSKRDGDTVKSGKMTKKLKRLLCDMHIPSQKRNRIPIICDEQGIVAVPHCCVRDGCKGGALIIRIYERTLTNGGLNEKEK